MKSPSALLVLAVSSGYAGVVTNTLDSGPGSLRQVAIDESPLSSVTFAPELSGKTITLYTLLYLGGGPGYTTRQLTIDASNLPGGITLAGGGQNRLFTVSSDGGLTLINLTLTGGTSDSFPSGFPGGAVENYGSTFLTRCTLTGNTGAAVGIDRGLVSMDHCTVTGNTGGAISNYYSGGVYLTHCTIWGNTTGQGFSPNISNTHRYGGMTVKNCIIAGGSPDVYNMGYFERQGANIIPVFENPTFVDRPGTHTGPAALTSAPLLAPLGDYGGPTRTMALLPGSPARNASVNGSNSADQRGYSVAGTPDIGAYEAGTAGSSYNAWMYENLPATATAAQREAAFDFDMDGQTNGEEFTYGTDPGSGASFFAPRSVPEGGSLRILFASAAGRSYTLQRNGTLLAPAWVNAPGQAVITGDGGVKSFLVSPGAAREFFRVLGTP